MKNMEVIKQQQKASKMIKNLVSKDADELKKEGDQAYIKKELKNKGLIEAYDNKKLKSKSLIKQAKSLKEEKNKNKNKSKDKKPESKIKN